MSGKKEASKQAPKVETKSTQEQPKPSPKVENKPAPKK